MSKSAYNFSSQLLHRMALQSPAIAEMSFDIENAVVNKKNKVFSGNPVFISGLARSGTTMLTRYLHETGLFRSLTYRDMPFVLMPNTWKRLTFTKPVVEYRERAHQDGIMVSYDSPEAFEEVFWKVFTGEKYIFKDRLQLYPIGNSVLHKFKDYVNNVLLSADNAQQGRYLSKNNNNILRLPYLQKCMPDAKIIIPYREPLQQAASLLAQHQHFCKIQSEDRFSLDYMNWLGHFEFGLNQKSFFLGDESTFGQMADYSKTDINFWLVNWRNYYQYALSQGTDNVIFFSYEAFCRQPREVVTTLFENLNIDAPVGQYEQFSPTAKTISGFDKDLLKECNAIYQQIIKRVGKL